MRRKGSHSVRRQSLYAAIERECHESEQSRRPIRTPEDAIGSDALDQRDPLAIARAASAALRGGTV